MREERECREDPGVTYVSLCHPGAGETGGGVDLRFWTLDLTAGVQL